MLWRSLRRRMTALPVLAVMFVLLVVALADHGNAGGGALALLAIFGPLFLLRSRTVGLVGLLSWFRRR